MSFTNDAETGFLALLFTNTAYTNIGDAGGLLGSSTAGSLYIALFTADPTDTGSVANEATYTGYARLAVARAGAQWTVSGTAPTQVVNDNTVQFAACTAGTDTITHFALAKAGTASVADLIITGALTASLAVSAGITPQFAAGALVFTLD